MNPHTITSTCMDRSIPMTYDILSIINEAQSTRACHGMQFWTCAHLV